MHAHPARLDDNARLSDLIRLGRVRVLFQPILDLAHGALLGFEALTRPGEGSLFTNAGCGTSSPSRAAPRSAPPPSGPPRSCSS